eukprot:5661553-Lingulodinium_polyedra.AAC.1
MFGTPAGPPVFWAVVPPRQAYWAVAISRVHQRVRLVRASVRAPGHAPGLGTSSDSPAVWPFRIYQIHEYSWMDSKSA